MRDRDLDHLLREKLNQISVTREERAWDAFEHRYNSENDFDTLAEEIHFDNQISEKSKQIKPRTSPQWPLLQNDLAIIHNRRTAVWHYKAIEALLVCFMIYAIILVPNDLLHKATSPTPTRKYNPYEYAVGNTNSFPKSYVQIKDRKDIKLNTNKVSGSISKVVLPSSTNTPSSYIDENVVVGSDNKTSPIDNVAILNNVIGGKNDFANLQTDIIKGGSDSPVELISNESVVPQEPSIALNSILFPTTSTFAEINTTVVEMGTSSNMLRDASVVEKLPVVGMTGLVSRPEANLNIDYLPLITPNPASEYALSFPIASADMKPDSRHLLSVWASRDINMINTPFDKIYSIASYQKEALNYSFGANFSRKRGKVDVSTGVEYAKRTYQPKPFTERYGTADTYYFESSLNKISYDIVSVPLKIKYDFLAKNKWNAYVMAGAALSMIVDAKYGILEEIIHENAADVSLSPSDSPRLESKNFIKGIGNFDSDIASLDSENGIFSSSFKDNYFASLTFGLGIEKKLSPRTSLYIEPSYQRHVFSNGIGIGPNKDKIHTSSLQLGFRTILL